MSRKKQMLVRRLRSHAGANHQSCKRKQGNGKTQFQHADSITRVPDGTVNFQPSLVQNGLCTAIRKFPPACDSVTVRAKPAGSLDCEGKLRSLPQTSQKQMRSTFLCLRNYRWLYKDFVCVAECATAAIAPTR